MKSLLIFVLATLFFGLQSQAQDCKKVLEDLKQMKVAQKAIQQSLVSNHELMSETIASYADALDQSAGKAHKTVVSNMKKSSGSLRERARSAQAQSAELAELTEQLIQEVQACLK